jgi:hypothetical protein
MLNFENPYIAGASVGRTKVFVGREGIVERIKNVLRNPNRNMLWLYGQRRVGKTSILEYLEEQLALGNSYFPVYFTLQGKPDSLDGVLQELAYTIVRKVDLPNLNPRLGLDPVESFVETWLPDVLSRLPLDSYLVLLLDEFDVLAYPGRKHVSNSNKIPSSYLFKYLKDLNESCCEKLQFVFVIGRHKEDLSIVARSLLKESSECLVSLLPADEIINLIRFSEQNESLYWDEAAIGRVIELTNGHPLFTQELCSRVWNLAHTRNSDVPTATYEDVDAVVPDFLDYVGDHLMVDLWGQLGTHERIVAAVLAEAGSKPMTQGQLEDLLQEKSQMRILIREVLDAPQRLRERDLLESLSDGKFKFRVEVVRQWITYNKVPGDVQTEVDDIESTSDNLYRAALGFYQDRSLNKARDILSEALNINPYHIKANLLLADIFVEQGELNEAQELLELFFKYQPTEASVKLIKVYLLLAKKAKGDDKQLELYGRVLEINRSQPEALKEWQKIWRFKASYFKKLAESSGKLEDLISAREAYVQADMQKEAQELELEIQSRAIIDGQHQLDELEREEQYLKALKLLNSLECNYPQQLWTNYRNRLELRAELAQYYQDAIDALSVGDYERARRFLVEIIKQDSMYKDVTLHFHRAVTGEDFSDLDQKLTESQRRYIQAESKVQDLEVELEQAQEKIIALEVSVEQNSFEGKNNLLKQNEDARQRIDLLEQDLLRAEGDIRQMRVKLDQSKLRSQEEADKSHNYEEKIDRLEKENESLRQRIESKAEELAKLCRKSEDYQKVQTECAMLKQKIRDIQSKRREDTEQSKILLNRTRTKIRKELNIYRISLVIVVVLSLTYFGYTLLSH